MGYVKFKQPACSQADNNNGATFISHMSKAEDKVEDTNVETAKEKVEEVKKETKSESTESTEEVAEEETPTAEATAEKSKKAAEEEAKAESKKEKPKAESKKPAKKSEKVEVKAEEKEEKEEKKPVKREPSKPETEEEILKLEVPTEDFDWDSADKGGFGEEYNEKEKSTLAEEYTETLSTIEEKEVLKGIVVGINDRDVILNIGFKSDGLVSASEFRDMPDLKAGDEVEVYVEEQENANGQLVLSRRIAKIVKAWEKITNALDQDEIIEGVVKRRTKGGLIVDVFGVEAFLPGSQIDVKPIRDFDVFVDKKMEVKVVKINYSNDNVVVSHKVLIEKDLEAQKAEILNNLEKGQVLEGIIKNMTNFGVFIDLGGVDGLLHITDISWGRINHPEEVLNLDAPVKVVVLDFDEDKKRISLGMKQLTAHPWDSLDKGIEVGSKVKGKIVNVADYGAFLEINPGVEGLIHVSEMSWSQHLRNPSDFLQVGDELEAVVLTLDRDERKMSLGIKQLTEDPWTKQDVLTKYAVETLHKGIVRNLTNFGLFIELEEGIDGLVHVSDLSWTKKIKHPSEFVKVGDELEVKVLELDVDNRRLALGHKQLEENPWDTFEEVFTIGSVHKCNVSALTEKGAILELPYGIEGFAVRKNLAKEDGANVIEGESIDFKVVEFAKDEKRITLSHTAMYKEEVAPPKPVAKKKKPSAIEKVNKDTEKETLGDLEALSEPAKAKKVEAKVEEEAEVAKEEKPKAKSTSKAKAKEEAVPKAETKTKAKAKVTKKTEAKDEKASEEEASAKEEK
jgi:small subunit ribosomal protein S1